MARPRVLLGRADPARDRRGLGLLLPHLDRADRPVPLLAAAHVAAELGLAAAAQPGARVSGRASGRPSPPAGSGATPSRGAPSAARARARARRRSPSR